MVTLLATETEVVRRAYSNATASLFVGETTRAVEAKKRTLAFVQAGSLTSRQLETTTYNVCILRVYIVYCRQIAGRRIRWELTIWQFSWDKEQLYMQDWLWKAQIAPTIAPRVNTWQFGGYLWCTASRSGLAVSESDCGVRGPSFESRRARLCLSLRSCDVQPWARAAHLYCGV